MSQKILPMKLLTMYLTNQFTGRCCCNRSPSGMFSPPPDRWNCLLEKTYALFPKERQSEYFEYRIIAFGFTGLRTKIKTIFCIFKDFCIKIYGIDSYKQDVELNAFFVFFYYIIYYQ